MQLLENMSSIKRSRPIRDHATAHKAQGAGTEKVETSGSKINHDNTTKKMMKPTKIDKTVKSSRKGINRSMAAQIEAQNGGGAVHKKCNRCTMQKKRDAMQKKCNGGAVRKKRGDLRSSG